MEEFDTITAAYDRGWRYINVSEPYGSGFWTQGMFNNPSITGFPAPIPFPAFSSKGSYVGFIGADYSSTSAAAGIISNWIVSPIVEMQNGDKIVFYTRTLAIPYQIATGVIDTSDFGNRLQVRVSKNAESVNVGSGANPGDFDNILLDINNFYHEWHTVANPTNPAAWIVRDPEAYPVNWTRFEAEVSGLNGVVKGRFALRYFTEDAGSNGRATCVAVDSVAYLGKY